MNEANNNFPKRNKTHQKDEANRDRLSELPESLLIKIISLLPLEEAVKTGLLSTRWKNLWNHINKLVFVLNPTDHEPPSPLPLKKFISFVDHILTHCDSPKLKKFRLFANLQYQHFNRKVLDGWLRQVYSRHVECIEVNIPTFTYTPRKWFYHNSSLVKLSIHDFNLTNLVQVSWTLLKSLSLSNVTLDDKQIANILSACPVLEDLGLYEVTEFSRLNIMSRSLVELTVVNCEQISVDGSLLEINAPWLRVLTLSGYFNGVFIQLIDVSSLVHANLNLEHCSKPVAEGYADEDLLSSNMAIKLLQSVNHVEELTFGQELVEALSILKMLGKPCPLFKCKRLTVRLPILKYVLPGMIYLLHSSPHLETLVIVVDVHIQDHVHQYLDLICDFDGAEYLSTKTGDLLHLRNLEVSYCRYGCCQDEEEECCALELTAFVVRNGRVLEKLLITSDEHVVCNCSSNCAWQYVSKLSHKFVQACMQGKEVGEWKVRKSKPYFEIIF